MAYKREVIDMMALEGLDADDMLQYLVLSLRDDKSLKSTLEAAGLSKNACRNIITGEGTVNLNTAVRIAEACGYRLTLEVRE